MTREGVYNVACQKLHCRGIIHHQKECTDRSNSPPLVKISFQMLYITYPQKASGIHFTSMMAQESTSSWRLLMEFTRSCPQTLSGHCSISHRFRDSCLPLSSLLWPLLRFALTVLQFLFFRFGRYPSIVCGYHERILGVFNTVA